MQIMNGQAPPVKSFVPLPAGGTAIYSATGVYYHPPDHLGSSRLISTSNRTMSYDGAYAPFGEPYAQAGTSDLSFTGQNQDTVGGLYDFPAREYSIQGRWPSPDPAGLAAVDPTNPQSWNRYTYVLNNPLALVDPLGLLPQCKTGCPWRRSTGSGCMGASETCSSGGSAWYPDDKALFQQMNYQMACGASPLNADCLTFAPRPGPNGRMQVFVSGGKMYYSDSASGTSGFLGEVSGDWITLTQFAKNVLEYDEL